MLSLEEFRHECITRVTGVDERNCIHCGDMHTNLLLCNVCWKVFASDKERPNVEYGFDGKASIDVVHEWAHARRKEEFDSTLHEEMTGE